MRAHEEYLPLTELEEKLTSLFHAITVNDVSSMRELLAELIHGFEADKRNKDIIHAAAV
jgi:hypothetical protein